MASFKRRGSTWQYVVEIGVNPVTGKRKQKTKGGFKTKKAAQLAASEIERAIVDGTYIVESNITFNEFAKKWLGFYSKLVKGASVETRVTSIKVLEEYLGFTPIRKVTKTKYIKILHDLHEKKNAVNTIKTVHAAASLIFGFARREARIIKEDPTKDIDFRFLDKGKDLIGDLTLNDNEKFLEKEDLGSFLKIAKNNQNPQDYIIFLTLAYTGLRRGELSVLKWSDVNFDNHTISVTKTYYSESKRANEVTPVSPKTRGSIREIDIDDFVVSELKKHRMWQNEYIMKNRKRYSDLGYIFINTHKYPGHPIPPQNIYDHMKTILRKMEYPIKLAPHSLRHTHASLCVEAGIDLEDIARRLGHDNMDTLKKIYVHMTKGKKEKTAKKFNDLMNEVRQEIGF